MRPSSISFASVSLRDLAPDAVERREHDRLRRVVDDDVDAGQVLERADVAALAADDPALHVVGRELDQRDGRLGGVARGDPLERVGDEVAGAALRLGARLLLEPAARWRASSWRTSSSERSSRMRLRLVDGHARDPLELRDAATSRVSLSSSWSCFGVHLSVGDALLAARELGQLLVDVLLLRRERAPRSSESPCAAAATSCSISARSRTDVLTRLDLRLSRKRRLAAYVTRLPR